MPWMAANAANAAGVLNSVGNPSDAGAGDGVYVYRASLDLTGFDLANTVISGKNTMPPFAAALTFAEIRDVAAYVATQLGK